MKDQINKPNYKVTLIGGVMDTRSNNEDFAITPYLSGVYASGPIIGLGLTLGWWAVFIGVAFNFPKSFDRFIVVNRHGEER